MASVFETRLIGNIGKDAISKNMDRGIIAINFPVAHNKNWKDKKTGELKTKTTWVNCTIWKKEGSNIRIVDYLTKGTMVEVIGTPVAKSYSLDDGSSKAEIRLNVSKTNILKPASKDDSADSYYEIDNEDENDENRDFSSDDIF
jgi:single-strand DNA-binding protein